MKVIFVAYNDWTREQRKILQLHGFKPEEGYSRIDIEENEKNAELLSFIDRWGLKKSVGTIYEKQDYSKSLLFVYVGNWNNGYPQPEDDFGYIGLTYNTDNYCKECGVGKTQKEAFRLGKSPKWGNKVMFELNWVFDEIFVKKDIYEQVFKKMGLESWKVKLFKNNMDIEDVVQLKIPVINTPLSLENQPYQICKVCDRKKYNPQVKGMFPAFSATVPELHLFKCSEYFGDGMRAFNRVFISKQLRAELEKLKIKPTLWPVDSLG